MERITGVGRIPLIGAESAWLLPLGAAGVAFRDFGKAGIVPPE
jgi:hypothetical protein